MKWVQEKIVFVFPIKGTNTQAKRIEVSTGKGRLCTSNFKETQTQAKRIEESTEKVVFVLPILKKRILRQR